MADPLDFDPGIDAGVASVRRGWTEEVELHRRVWGFGGMVDEKLREVPVEVISITEPRSGWTIVGPGAWRRSRNQHGGS